MAGASPREAINDLIDDSHSAVAADLLARAVKQPPEFLEQLVLTLLARMGYGGLESPTEHLGGPGDRGLDGLIRMDKLGLDVVYVQAKRYTDRHVRKPEIQAFVGALHGAQAARGVFITTTRFSPEARDYAERVNARLVLIDGPELANLMIEHNCGVVVEETFTLKQVDENFSETSNPRLRQAGRRSLCWGSRWGWMISRDEKAKLRALRSVIKSLPAQRRRRVLKRYEYALTVCSGIGTACVPTAKAANLVTAVVDRDLICIAAGHGRLM